MQLPIIKRDGTKSAASLWLKQKRDVTGAPIYIWIFEEIAESLVNMTVTSTVSNIGVYCPGKAPDFYASDMSKTHCLPMS
jgi:hypothetical protein